MPISKNALRILYAAGEGDILGTFHHWKTQQDDPSQVSMTYSGQFFDLCHKLGGRGAVLVHCDKLGQEKDDQFLIKQGPLPRFRTGPGILYHAEQTFAAFGIIAMAVRQRADVVVTASGAAHWFPLSLLRLFGIKVVPALHCVLWPKFRKPGRLGRIVNWLDAKFFAKSAAAIMTASSDIDDQLAELTGRKLNLFNFMPTYRRESFPTAVQPPRLPPFRVLYAGRLEPEKGVFDLLAAAQMLKGIVFDICGTGSALEELKKHASATFRVHGHCDRARMLKFFQYSHTVVVPTRSEFVEGFNQVVAEGILAGRPVIASSVCPAVKYLAEAVITVPPDDAHTLAREIRKLADDPAHYERCRSHCANVQSQFFDPARSWGAALEAALKTTVPNRLSK
jgi:glycosyltransferase involved in cell wall biosynthesis